jgi:hypothetical protein
MRLLSLSALFLTMIFALAISGQEKEGKKGPNPFAGPYKNLKLLKPEQMQPAMMAARTGFGQACAYCHVPGLGERRQPQEGGIAHDVHSVGRGQRQVPRRWQEARWLLHVPSRGNHAAGRCSTCGRARQIEAGPAQ